MRCQVELHQLQERGRVAARIGQADAAGILDAAFERQRHVNLIGGESVRGELRAEIVQQPRDQEGKRLEQFERMLEGERTFEGHGLDFGNQGAYRESQRPPVNP